MRHLGFIIPPDVLWRAGKRDRMPRSRFCHHCGQTRDEGYQEYDGRWICEWCIERTFAMYGPMNATRRTERMVPESLVGEPVVPDLYRHSLPE